MPGTSAISSTVAARSRFTEPKCLSSALRRASPSPGTSSSALVDHRLGAPLAVVGDREPVRLVADPLQQVEALAGARQDHRVVLAGQPDLLEPLGQAARAATSSMPSSSSAALGRGDLRRAAVDDDEVRAGRRTSAAGRSSGSIRLGAAVARVVGVAGRGLDARRSRARSSR